MAATHPGPAAWPGHEEQAACPLPRRLQGGRCRIPPHAAPGSPGVFEPSRARLTPQSSPEGSLGAFLRRETRVDKRSLLSRQRLRRETRLSAPFALSWAPPPPTRLSLSFRSPRVLPAVHTPHCHFHLPGSTRAVWGRRSSQGRRATPKPVIIWHPLHQLWGDRPGSSWPRGRIGPRPEGIQPAIPLDLGSANQVFLSKLFLCLYLMQK